MMAGQNGNGHLPGGLALDGQALVLPALDPAAIKRAVEAQERATEQLRARMESDYGLYLLEADEAEEGYERYISNEPQVFADKIIAWLANAKLMIRFPLDSKVRPQRARDDRKEQFIQGVLRWADENMADLALPSIREQLSFFITLRGGFAGRALFVKRPDETTALELTPWDPLHTRYGMGRDGLVWACYKMQRSALELRDEFGVEDLPDKEDGYEVLDYYDRYQNAVLFRDGFLRPPQPHYAGRVPVFVGAAAAGPPIMRRDNVQAQDASLHYGESVFKANRGTYATFNKTMGYYATLVRMSVEQGLVLYSATGKKALPGDPRKAHTILSLSKDDKLAEIPIMEMSREAGAFVGNVAGEMQRGSLAHSSYGDLQFQISGYALSLLRQGNDAAIQPRVRALEAAYSQIIRMLCKQYSEGGFAPIDLRGATQDGNWFDSQYSAFDTQDSLGRAVSPIVKLVPVLPQDDQAKFAMAQIARAGPSPLLPLREVLDKVLEYQNVDAVMDMLKEERGEQLSPIAALITLIDALLKQGREELARPYMEDLNQLIMERQAAGLQPQGAALGAASGGALPGMPPEVMPAAANGLAPPMPVPQGPLPTAAPGQPRPGRTMENERLRRLGLVR